MEKLLLDYMNAQLVQDHEKKLNLLGFLVHFWWVLGSNE